MDYFEQMRLQNTDLIDNTANRVPICIVVDTSYSMIEEGRIKHVNNGIKNFIDNSKADEYAVDSLDICIISCGGEKATIVHPFTNVAKLRFSDLKPSGQTPLGQAIVLGIEEIDERIGLYTAQGITTFKPWLIIMSDGKASDDIKRASKMVRDHLNERKIKVKCIDMSDGKGGSSLDQFTIDGDVQTINSFMIEDFFSMLSRSAVALSTSTPGEDTMGINIL